VPITPLPQFEADLAEHLAEQADREAYERLNVPKTLVVRFGVMKMVGEFPYDGDAKPGCGSKIVVRTHRGTEIGEMLTSTCPNAGCSKSVTRKQMLEYIDNSGGRDYPFTTDGRALRVATKEDMDRQAALDASKAGMVRAARALVEKLRLPMKMVEAEPLLGGERVTYYYHSEERVDFRGLLQELRPLHECRIELRQVGARDEARLAADYERCGQYCCCKNFLKVLKPVSMKSAKTQKATLDPLKISGRCGRLMCCLRYEDETYEELRKRLPKKGSRVGTPEGDGVVVDGQILTQLVLVALDGPLRQVAVPVEELTEAGLERPKPEPRAEVRAERRPDRPADRRGERRGEARGGPRGDQRGEQRVEQGREPGGEQRPADEAGTGEGPRKRRRRRGGGEAAAGGAGSGPGAAPADVGGTEAGRTPEAGADGPDGGVPARKKRRRRRRSGGGESGGAADAGAPDAGTPESGPSDSAAGGGPGAEAGPRKKRRRRRRGGGGGGSAGEAGGGAGGGGGGGDGGGGD
jgi:cell fate regulator YaaT (PSP1 superfamily)